MNTSARTAVRVTVGARLRKLRRRNGLTQQALAEPEFSKRYVGAIERGSMRPSTRAVEVLARRLCVPAEHLLSASEPLNGEPDVVALQEDILYQSNYAKMLIRSGQVQEAFQAIDEIDTFVGPYHKSLPAGVAYLVPFLRGRAYLQMLAPNQARPELEAALTIAQSDPEACARVRNLLGVAFFELGQVRAALEQHLLCRESIRAGTIADLNFRVNVYGNLANNYWALNEPQHAISMYKEVLPILEDLNDLTQQARTYWGLSTAYSAARDWPHARLYALRALHIYEATDNSTEAASICLNLAEMLLNEQSYAEALELLERTERLLADTGHTALLSYLHKYYAELARAQGTYDRAAQHAEQSITLARSYREAIESDAMHTGNLWWLDPTRTNVEALQTRALIYEVQGNTKAADLLFGEALELVEKAGFEETKQAIYFTYAKVLQERSEFEMAVGFYREAMELQSQVARRAI